MYAQIRKSKESKGRESGISVALKKSNGKQGLEFMGNQPQEIVSNESQYFTRNNKNTVVAKKQSYASNMPFNLTDDKDLITNKIKKAKTDDSPMPSDNSNLEKRPEVENLLGIYSSLNNQNLEKSIEEFSGKNFSDFKQKLSEVVVEKISPISSEINKLLKDKNHIDSILAKGAEKADKISSKKIKELKKIIGF